MKNDVLVSVIVPIYNREYSIRKCFDSILSQTYENLELICIDDGSTDNSLCICQEYAQKDNRVIVKHINNGGVSNARNVGVDVSSGEYIFFVDSDDYIDPNHIEVLMPKGNEDLVFGGFKHFIDGKMSKIHQYECETIEFKRGRLNQEGLNKLIYNLPSSVCLSCYKTSLIKKHNLKFNTRFSMAEDLLFNFEYLKNCELIKSTNSTTYYYENGEHDSLVYTYHEDFFAAHEKVFIIQDEILDRKSFTERWLNWHMVLNYYKKWKSSENKQIKNSSSRMLKNVYKSPYFRESISYIRKHGSLDQKIETFFMNFYLYPFYKPLYKLIEIFGKIKRKF